MALQALRVEVATTVVTEGTVLVMTEVEVTVETVAVLRETVVLILTMVVTLVVVLETVDCARVVGFKVDTVVVVLKAVCKPPMIEVLVVPLTGEVTVTVVALGCLPGAVLVK